MEHRLEPVAGVDGDRLVVRGPNVMAGYLRPEGGGLVEAPEGGWYDTGDIVRMSAGGHVTIVGRAKRFAKIGGEMVLLAAVEALAAEVWPGEALGAVALPDPRKGQRIVLAIANPAATLDAMRAHARRQGWPKSRCRRSCASCPKSRSWPPARPTSPASRRSCSPTPADISRILRFRLLAPDIVEAILDG